MAKTNKQQKEIDELIIERNNLIDTVEILEKWTRQIAKILWLDWIAETTYFNDADIETIEKAIEKLQGKYEKCFEELSMKCGECEWLLKANETIVKAHNDLEHENKRLSDLLHLYDNKDWKEHSEEQKIKELELDKKDLQKRLIEWLQINIEKVEKIWELENEIKELKTRLEDVETDENTKLLLAENQVFKNEANELRCEMSRQIIEKNTYRKENKKLKKRRRSHRYDVDHFVNNCIDGYFIYVEWWNRPTKKHKHYTDAMSEANRLRQKTWKRVYIIWKVTSFE